MSSGVWANLSIQSEIDGSATIEAERLSVSNRRHRI
jgi:hypothetical protein